MMLMKSEEITIPSLLEKYRGWVEKGEIQFLKDSKSKNDILNHLGPLIQEFKEADRIRKTFDENKKETDYGLYLNWAETHKKGYELWKKLASYALKNIDSNSKGNSKLFEFLEKATDFEDLLYGLEIYYRDHTLHSMWVYFLGEHILRDHLPDIRNNLNWYIYNDIERDKEILGFEKETIDKLIKTAEEAEEEFREELNEYRDAIWCIIALCHDLGYSLSKLNKLNEKVRSVLEFFDLTHFQKIGYMLDVEDQYIVSQFLELMAVDIRMFPFVEGTNVQTLLKCYRDDSTYWRLCRALEGKRHGILSSYLIYKILGTFSESSVRGSAEEWGLEDDEVINSAIRGDILFAITQHDFEFAHLSQLSSLADILVLVDEIEEFSRYGRQLLSRKYQDTTAKVEIEFKSSNTGNKETPTKIEQGDDLEIIIKYTVAEQLKSKEEFYGFFKQKAEKLCQFYSLSLSEEDRDNYSLPDKNKNKYCNIKSILMSIEHINVGKMYFLLHRNEEENKIYLPKTLIKPEKTVKPLKPKEREYKVSCLDDVLIVHYRGKDILLKDWLENAEELKRT